MKENTKEKPLAHCFKHMKRIGVGKKGVVMIRRLNGGEGNQLFNVGALGLGLPTVGV